MPPRKLGIPQVTKMKSPKAPVVVKQRRPITLPSVGKGKR
jgi:hypothetical protein